MKIYTKTGDTGTTGLFGGERILKHHPRIEAYGTIDELNAHLGRIASLISPTAIFPLELVPLIQTIQRDLFTIGSHLATATQPPLRQDGIIWQENIIDQIDAQLPELRAFILPGGSSAGSTCHVARTICRRAERRVIELAQAEEVDPYIIQYLNRLSDLLFQLARLINQTEGKTELLWK